MDQIEQAADQNAGMTAHILQRAGALDAEADTMTSPEPEMQAEAMPAMDDETELRGMLEIGGAVLGVAYPKAGAAMSRHAPTLAAAVVPVLQKYGWTLQGKFGVELSALAVALPAGIEIAAGFRADRQDKARAMALAEQKKAEQDGKQSIAAG